MREEIERFTKDIKGWSPTELKEVVIEGLDCLKKGVSQPPVEKDVAK